MLNFVWTNHVLMVVLVLLYFEWKFSITHAPLSNSMQFWGYWRLMQIKQRIFKCGDMQIKHFILDKILNLSSISCYEVVSFFLSFFLSYFGWHMSVWHEPSICCLSSVCLSVTITLLHLRHRLELFDNIFAPPNRSGARTVCTKILSKIRSDSSGSCKLNTRGMKNWRFSNNISLYFTGTRRLRLTRRRVLVCLAAYPLDRSFRLVAVATVVVLIKRTVKRSFIRWNHT